MMLTIQMHYNLFILWLFFLVWWKTQFFQSTLLNEEMLFWKTFIKDEFSFFLCVYESDCCMQYAVATKIIQQAVTLFFSPLYISYIAKAMDLEFSSICTIRCLLICMICFSSIDQTVHFLLKKKIIFTFQNYPTSNFLGQKTMNC